ncbi:phosphoglycolate phosphatase [Luteimonas sp. MC1750]|uniref:phosphoglycolate phosphatase n=1 Tax=Luteimonas sp. MC1750 TaxID=2799326 RepID=UPI0018F06488|nr:phosphoglycolate phosphatase [Luteimonas sp. MC1750]MBJ6984265.1 phosphoglycolate phosphatase [Luteimonas sp. MC1750]QQO05107.1 phosphoglycolate phosphatase [Luteimonas sp. MC1750]
MSGEGRRTGGRFPRCVLFDLDGTLLDSAPDMAATVNRMRAARGVAPMPLAQLRPHVSKGARAMSAAAFPGLGGEVPAELIREFLDVYAEELGRHGAAFDGIEAMLSALEADGARWGIVTNKPEYLARGLMPALGWESRSGVLIGGDTLAERKPHPLPLLHAADAMGFAVADCVYVGDDERDIVAARAAGMRSLVALWGYRLEHDDPRAWQADTMVESPQALLDPDAWP